MVQTLERRQLLAAPEIAPLYGSAPIGLGTNHDSMLSTTEGSIVTGYDPDGGGVTLEIGTDAQNGTATVVNGNLTYMPDAQFVGNDSFTVRYRDGDGEVSSALEVVVSVTNSGPQLSAMYSPDPTVASFISYKGEVVTSDGSYLQIIDNESDVAQLSVTNDVQHGTLVFNSVTGGFVYTPHSTFSGLDTFTITGTDGFTNGQSPDTVTVRLNVTNMPPSANDDSGYFALAGASTFTYNAAVGVLHNDTDFDAIDVPYLTASVVQTTTLGTLNLNSDGSFTYEVDESALNGADSAVDTFTYTCSDGIDTSNIATVTIDIGTAKITSMGDDFEPVDQTEQTRNTVVGKRERLDITITGNPNVDFTVGWTVNGDVMKSYNFATGVRTDLTQTDLAQKQIAWAWVSDSGQRTVSAAVSIGGNSVNLKTYFNVVRPTINVTTTIRPVSFRNDLTTFGSSGGFVVGLGSFDQEGNRTAHGIELTANNPSIPGTVKWMQFLENHYEKITYADSNQNPPLLTCVTHYLDAPPGTAPEYPSANGTMTDSPKRKEQSIGTTVSYERVDTFASYVMYKASAADYYVPLKVVEWSWSAKVSRTTPSDPWVLESSSYDADQTGEDAADYPDEWTNTTNDLQ